MTSISSVDPRQHLIDLCERGVVPQDKWLDRDTARAQRQLGEALVLLKAGCEFRINPNERLQSTARMIWIEVEYKGFDYFEEGDLSDDTFYIPTDKRLREVDGGDWYC